MNKAHKQHRQTNKNRGMQWPGQQQTTKTVLGVYRRKQQATRTETGETVDRNTQQRQNHRTVWRISNKDIAKDHTRLDKKKTDKNSRELQY